MLEGVIYADFLMFGIDALLGVFAEMLREIFELFYPKLAYCVEF